MRIRTAVVVGGAFLLACLCALSPVSADVWRYDFNPGEDLSAFAAVNPTGLPTYSLSSSLDMVVPARSSSGYGGFDLCDWVNRDALRLRRAGGGEPFTLETCLSTETAGYTYLSGLYLYSASGGTSDDLVFGANSTALKIDRGSASQSGMPGWLSIGAYDSLYLQVDHDGVSTTHFNYKKALGDSWSLYATLNGFTFDQVGIITKTWSPGSGQPSPAVNADFAGLCYNCQIPEPTSLVMIWSLLAACGVALAWRRRRRRG